MFYVWSLVVDVVWRGGCVGLQCMSDFILYQLFVKKHTRYAIISMTYGTGSAFGWLDLIDNRL